MPVANTDMRHLIESAAANTKRLGFDVTQHATTIALIATEVAEALDCLGPATVVDASPALFKFRHRLRDCASEFEEYRKGAVNHRDTVEITYQEDLDKELADIVIRVFSYVGGNGRTEEFVTALQEKMRENATRPPKHGKAF